MQTSSHLPSTPTSQEPTSQEIQALFDRIAPVYDDFNQQLSLGLHRIWKQMAVDWSRAASGQTCLDVCCGSGDLALLLANCVGKAGQVYGLDFSAAQLEIARQKETQSSKSAHVHWIEGDALNLPFEENLFEAATMAYGLRNLTDIPRGLQELHRVLQPSARASILDFHRPQNTWMRQFQQWYLQTIVVPASERCGLTEEYAYINPSIERFPTGAEQVHLGGKAGFSQATHYPILGGMMGVLVLVK